MVIREVQTLKELRSFIRFPQALYRDHPYYVPALFEDQLNTLRRDVNPAFAYCEARYWLAFRGGQVVGRVAAILNRRHIEKWNQPYLRFGWLDFVDDRAVSSALMKVVEDWAREKGLIAVHGPLGFTNLDRAGMLVEGFDELATLATIYNYPYYPQHLEALGYCKDIDWVEQEIIVPAEPDEKVARLAEAVKRRYQLSLRVMRTKKELLEIAPQMFAVLNEEYAKIYGVVPLSESQVKGYIDQYIRLVDPQFIPLVQEENGRVVAFFVSVPSLARALQKSRGRLFPFGWLHLWKALRKNYRVDMYLGAIRAEYQGRGVSAVMMDHIARLFIQKGITRIETNPELETNLAVQAQWSHFETRYHKRRRCYIRMVESPNG